jgi:uncharacterized membrane protein
MVEFVSGNYQLLASIALLHNRKPFCNSNVFAVHGQRNRINTNCKVDNIDEAFFKLDTAFRRQPDEEKWQARSEFLKLFLLPITATVIMLIVGSLRTPRSKIIDDPSADAAIDDIIFFVVLFLIAVHALLLAVLLSVPWVGPWASRGVVVLVGLTLMGIGNLLPRTRPNHALGIRTARTLADRQLWMLTHRVSGYTAVAVGAATICGGLLIDQHNVAKAAGIPGIVGAAIILGCYLKFTVASRRVRQV